MLPRPLAPVLLALAGAGGDEPLAPRAWELVRSVELESRPGTWVQHFRLEREGARPEEAPEGLLRYVAGPDPDGGLHVELELHFLADGVRLIHVEQRNAARRRLVFRELLGRTGRTLFLEGGEVLEGYELGGAEVVRRAPEEDGALPLLLLEAVRCGASPPDEARVLDPLSARFEPLRFAFGEHAGGRVFEARRPDGSLRWRASMGGRELRELRFQDRGPVARPISQPEYEHLRLRSAGATRSALEASSPVPAPRRMEARYDWPPGAFGERPPRPRAPR